MLLIPLTGGCAVKRDIVPLNPKPLLIHLPGVAGDNAIEQWYLSALRTGGFDADTRLYDWTSKSSWITVLQEQERNRAQAERLATEVAAFATDHPERPIFISSDSGGAGPTIWMLEALPSNVNVAAVVLLAPAISPDYDLSGALRRVRGKMLVFSSPGDTLVLSWGTRTYGTIDGKRVAAAGVHGFTMPTTAIEPEQYRKLQPMPYNRDWFAEYGNNGDHTATMGTRFVSGFLAPLLTEMALETISGASKMSEPSADSESTVAR